MPPVCVVGLMPPGLRNGGDAPVVCGMGVMLALVWGMGLVLPLVWTLAWVNLRDHKVVLLYDFLPVWRA